MAFLTIPESPEELKEFLNEPDKVEKVFGEKSSADTVFELIDGYAKKVNKADPDLDQQIKDAEAKGMEAAIEKMGVSKRRPPMDTNSRTNKGERYNPNAPAQYWTVSLAV